MIYNLFTDSFDVDESDYSDIMQQEDDIKNTINNIHCWMKKHISWFPDQVYTINEDLSITINGSIKITKMLPDEIDNAFLFPWYINIKEVTGNLTIFELNIKTLVGCPQVVGGSFSLCYCNELISLKGSPKEIKGNFYCAHNIKLSSLKSGCKKVGGNYTCLHCKIKSLKGCPDEVFGNFNVSFNLLKDLVGGPSLVHGEYICNNCNLTTLNGCASNVKSLICSHNKIEELSNDNGFPLYIDSSLNFSDNRVNKINLNSKTRIMGIVDGYKNNINSDKLIESFKPNVPDIRQILYY